ncbi:MAG: hypothetical protein ACO4CW_13005, partial [Planctomycetota bacterium]
PQYATSARAACSMSDSLGRKASSSGGEYGTGVSRAPMIRIGASSLLADLERQLEFHATGRYSARHHHPMG